MALGSQSRVSISKLFRMTRESYRQVLPELDLSIERLTENVPADGQWYLVKAGETVGRFRSLKAAQTAWREIVCESGSKPTRRERDVS
jgi:hypothetical protein